MIQLYNVRVPLHALWFEITGTPFKQQIDCTVINLEAVLVFAFVDNMDVASRMQRYTPCISGRFLHVSGGMDWSSRP
jgi:hypothetical protein